ncbi:IspD/TarI family cytidylyltransferase [Alistipes megaguti]|uniref:IspD/TarI family cytidylyltransferase n=1 Tax=Alistipes megaguti TaxID=2364787 RepID=UPI002353B688|nr:2-C-methyl-D-erythritol 4-phosphate cytidylyltransferase [Alistipes megaguti]
MERIGVIIVAGGSGRRMGGSIPKQFRLLGGQPVLARTIGNFAAAWPGAEIVVVLPESHIAFWKDFAARFEVARHQVVAGGAERFDSVRCGLSALRSDPDLIAVQDGVRPLGSVEMIRRVAQTALRYGAAIPVVEPADSFREVEAAETATNPTSPANANSNSEDPRSHPLDRSRLRIVQTPQIFRSWLLREAYAQSYRREFTDDASVVEAAGYPVSLARGERSNLKLTTPEDFIIAEALLSAREEEEAQRREGSTQHGEEADDPTRGKAPTGEVDRSDPHLRT